MGNVCWSSVLTIIFALGTYSLPQRCHIASRRCTPDPKAGISSDLIISRREHLNSIRITRAYQGVDCDIVHSLVCIKIQMRPKKFHHVKQPAKNRINTTATAIPEKVSLFKGILSTKLEDCQELDTDDHWQHIRNATHAAALQTFGKKEPKSQDWFNANIAIL